MLALLEGNIAAGKSTLGKILSASDQFEFVPEPVDRWQTGFAANLLERFYGDMQRWSFTLQICAFMTRTQALEGTSDRGGKHVVFERSVYCDRHVFAKNLHRQGFMDDTEWSLYLNFWEYLKNLAPHPDAILYLRTPAEVCFRRLRVRGRAEEHGISLEYLRQLEECHDEWLLNPQSAERPVIVLDGTQMWTDKDIQLRLARILA